MNEKAYDLRLNDLAKLAHDRAVEKGFWDGKENQNLGKLLMLVVTELAEIMEEDRRGALETVSSKVPAINRFEEEIADVFIRLLDIAGAYKLNLEMAIKLKMMYNQNREKLHGKRY